MNSPKVSIILPVYNVSEFLEKCLDSIINQSLKEIEIIIIKDCSPDPFDNIICQEYADKDDRIVYVKHEKNLGLGGARNTGIKLSKADYIGFVDSDDFIDAPAYTVRSIVETLGHEQVDLLKMDVEGAEDDIIDGLRHSRLPPLQLLVEFHHRFPGIGKERTAQAIDGLRQLGYRIFDISETGREIGFVLDKESIE